MVGKDIALRQGQLKGVFWVTDPLVERMTAVEVGLVSLGKTVDKGFEDMGTRMTSFEGVLMDHQKAIGESAGRMNEARHSRDESSSSTHRELNRVWEILKLPLVGVIGGVAAKVLDRFF